MCVGLVAEDETRGERAVEVAGGATMLVFAAANKSDQIMYRSSTERLLSQGEIDFDVLAHEPAVGVRTQNRRQHVQVGEPSFRTTPLQDQR